MRKQVIKFGGTCLGNKQKYKWIVNEIKTNYVRKQIFPIIVVSAISSKNKEEGTTSNLIKCLSSNDYTPHLDSIKKNHMKLITDLHLDNTDIYESITPKFKEIELLAQSSTLLHYNTNEHNNVNHILYENIVKIGEDLSAELLKAYLIQQGLQTTYFNLENIIPSDLKTTVNIQDEGISDNIYDLYVRSMFNTNQALITSGYIGNWGNYGGILNVLNRGYSDYTGAMISKAVHANKMIVYKESSAIFTLNPTKYKQAKLVDTMSFDELTLLTNAGNEALHKHATDILKKDNIPISIRNAFSDTIEETNIGSYSDSQHIVALTDKQCHIVYVPIESIHDMCSILTHLQNNISIDINAISYTQKELSIIISGDIDNIDVQSNMKITSNKKLISMIGHHIHNNVGIAGKIFYTISKLDVNINNIIQTNSENCLSFVVDENKSEKILETLHDTFIIQSSD